MNTTAINEKLQENRVFFNSWSKSYDYPLFQFWMRRFYRPLLKDIPEDHSVLDVSCGSGEFLRELSEKTAAKLHGMDFSEKMVKLASQKLYGKVDIMRGDVHQLPYGDNTFDDVVSTEAFHHYHDQKKALQEMKRVAKKGGKVIIADINFFIRFIHRSVEHLEPGCVKINSPREMKNFFLNEGFVNITQKRSFLFSVITTGV